MKQKWKVWILIIIIIKTTTKMMKNINQIKNVFFLNWILFQTKINLNIWWGDHEVRPETFPRLATTQRFILFLKLPIILGYSFFFTYLDYVLFISGRFCQYRFMSHFIEEIEAIYRNPGTNAGNTLPLC